MSLILTSKNIITWVWYWLKNTQYHISLILTSKNIITWVLYWLKKTISHEFYIDFEKHYHMSFILTSDKHYQSCKRSTLV